MVLGLFNVVCVFVGLYFLRTKIKIGLTRCHILRLKCTKIDFFWGSAQTPLGELTALAHDPLQLDLRGPTSKGKEGEGGKGREEGMEGRGEGRGKWRGKG